MFIAVPTKKRAGEMKIMKRVYPELKEAGYSVILFVEPQDWDSYQQHYPDVAKVIMQDNDKGIGYARHMIQQYAFENKHDSVIMIDDNVLEFRGRNGEITAGGHPRIKRCDSREAVSHLASLISSWGYAGLSASHSNFKLKDKAFTGLTYGRIWKVFGMTPELWEKGVRFDVDGMPFEDFDFTAQAIKAGYSCPISIDYAFETSVQIGKTPGGIQCFDRDELSRLGSQYMQNKWGQECVGTTINKRSGRIEPRFKWAQFRKLANSGK